MGKDKYRILTGEYAGQIFEGVGCNARLTPDGPVDTSLGDGIYFPAIGLRLRQERPDEGVLINSGDGWTTKHYQPLVVPYDKYGNEIRPGDIVFAAAKSSRGGGGVFRLQVNKLGGIFHAGCGWLQRELIGTNLDDGKRSKISYPSSCIKTSLKEPEIFE